MRILLSAALVVALTGCPDPPTPESQPTAEKTAQVNEPRAKTAEPAPGPEKTSKTVTRSPKRTVRIAPRTVFRPQRGFVIGLVEIKLEPEPVAWVAVGIGEMAFRARLRRGDLLYAAGGVLEVTGLEPDGAAELRWILEVAEPSKRARIPRAPRGSPLELPSMGLYGLPDGRVVAVGNVRVNRTPGAPAALVVSVSVFPVDYQRDPTMGYDLHEQVEAEVTLRGKVAQLKVQRLEKDTPAQRGLVVLTVR